LEVEGEGADTKVVSEGEIRGYVYSFSMLQEKHDRKAEKKRTLASFAFLSRSLLWSHIWAAGMMATTRPSATSKKFARRGCRQRRRTNQRQTLPPTQSRQAFLRRRLIRRKPKSLKRLAPNSRSVYFNGTKTVSICQPV
jgi:hypothetical protein